MLHATAAESLFPFTPCVKPRSGHIKLRTAVALAEQPLASASPFSASFKLILGGGHQTGDISKPFTLVDKLPFSANQVVVFCAAAAGDRMRQKVVDAYDDASTASTVTKEQRFVYHFLNAQKAAHPSNEQFLGPVRCVKKLLRLNGIGKICN